MQARIVNRQLQAISKVPRYAGPAAMPCAICVFRAVRLPFAAANWPPMSASTRAPSLINAREDNRYSPVIVRMIMVEGLS